MSTGQEPANLDKAEIKELEESMAKNGAADIQSTDPENAVTLSAFAHLDEKKILRKMDWHIIPVLTILYLFSFLDRKWYPDFYCPRSRISSGSTVRSKCRNSAIV